MKPAIIVLLCFFLSCNSKTVRVKTVSSKSDSIEKIDSLIRFLKQELLDREWLKTNDSLHLKGFRKVDSSYLVLHYRKDSLLDVWRFSFQDCTIYDTANPYKYKILCGGLTKQDREDLRNIQIVIDTTIK